MIKDELNILKQQLLDIEQNLQGNMSILTDKEEKFKKLDQTAKEILETNADDIVRLNVGGKKFATTIKTLLNISDTLFYKVIITKSMDLKKEIFFDRTPDMFHYLLDYLRYKKINYDKFTLDELFQLKEESEYFEILPIEQYLEDTAKEKIIINVEVGAYYYESSNLVGTKDYKVLSDPNLSTGICTVYPSWFLSELNYEHWVEEIEIGGYTGKSDWIYADGYGNGSTVYTSIDKKTWNNVGQVARGFGQTILKFKVAKSKAKYVKFEGNCYFGIGYLRFL
jgi:hypothetical protein